jgi:hypothetical protein
MVSTRPELSVRRRTTQAPASAPRATWRWPPALRDKNNHENSRLDIEPLQNTLMSKPGFMNRFHLARPEIAAFRAFFSCPLCHIGSQRGFS